MESNNPARYLLRYICQTIAINNKAIKPKWYFKNFYSYQERRVILLYRSTHINYTFCIFASTYAYIHIRRCSIRNIWTAAPKTFWYMEHPLAGCNREKKSNDNYAHTRQHKYFKMEILAATSVIVIFFLIHSLCGIKFVI